MNDDQLDDALRLAPRTAAPPEPNWPALEARMRATADHPRRNVLTVAAALALFCLGGLAGIAADRALEGRVDERADVTSASAAFLAATRIQSTGSAYLAAVGEMDALARGPATADALAFHQGYEAALSVVAAVAETLRDAPVAEGAAEDLATEARRVRTALGARGSSLFQQEKAL